MTSKLTPAGSRILSVVALCAIAAGGAGGALTRQATGTGERQGGLPPEPPLSGRSSHRDAPGPGRMGEVPPEDEQLRSRQRRAMGIERQKKLLFDVHRLQTIAVEIDRAVVDMNNDQVPKDVSRKLDEIQKLARTVRDRMRQE